MGGSFSWRLSALQRVGLFYDYYCGQQWLLPSSPLAVIPLLSPHFSLKRLMGDMENNKWTLLATAASYRHNGFQRIKSFQSWARQQIHHLNLGEKLPYIPFILFLYMLVYHHWNDCRHKALQKGPTDGFFTTCLLL